MEWESKISKYKFILTIKNKGVINLQGNEFHSPEETDEGVMMMMMNKSLQPNTECIVIICYAILYILHILILFL